MAAQMTLTHPVLVRIQAGQPFDAPPERGLLMACGRLNPKLDYANTIDRRATNGPEPVEGLMACGRHTRTR